MYQDPQSRTQLELDALIAERETELGTEATQPSDPGGAPAESEAVAAPQADPAPTPAPATPQPPPASDPDVAGWKHRFETLQGKYHAEVPRLHQELRQLRAELDTVRRSPQPPAPPVADLEESAEYRALVEEYGDTAARAMVGIARREAHRTTEAMTRQHVEPLAQSVADQQREAYHGHIAALAGDDWLNVNYDQRFIDWTQAHKDPYSGQTLKALLNEAYASGDTARVARFFNDFRAASTRAPTTQPPAPTTPSRAVRDQDAMRAPPRRSTPMQHETDTNPGQVWSWNEVNTFYDDQAKGRYRGREKEAKEMEAQVQAAMRDNRVV